MSKNAQEEISRIKAPIDTALLDEIARGIRLLNKKIEAQVPEGVKDEATVDVAGPIAVAMRPGSTNPPWFRASVFNDGPDPVYVFLNDVDIPSERHAPINKGESLEIDTVEAKIQALWFANIGDTETASVRVQLLQ